MTPLKHTEDAIAGRYWQLPQARGVPGAPARDRSSASFGADSSGDRQNEVGDNAGEIGRRKTREDVRPKIGNPRRAWGGRS
jgi:hypothetical protein